MQNLILYNCVCSRFHLPQSGFNICQATIQRSDIRTDVCIKTAVFWTVTLCNLVDHCH